MATWSQCLTLGLTQQILHVGLLCAHDSLRSSPVAPKYHPWYLEALQTPAGPAFLAIPFAPVHQSQALRHTRPRPEITTFCFSEYCVIKYLIVYHLDDFSVMF